MAPVFENTAKDSDFIMVDSDKDLYLDKNSILQTINDIEGMQDTSSRVVENLQKTFNCMLKQLEDKIDQNNDNSRDSRRLKNKIKYQ
jgi:gas vesicle protein